MSKFKVGDKVRIIRALGSSVERGLKFGDETEIIQTCQSSSGHTDYIIRCPNPLYVGDGGFFLEHEIEPVVADRPQTKKQKHIYIRVDKEIEPGDLVRCVKDNPPRKKGDIRKVKELGKYYPDELFRYESKNETFCVNKSRWEVIHKLKVGDWVEHVNSGISSRVTQVYPDLNRFNSTHSCWLDPDHFRLYQKPKTEWGINTFPIEPVTYGLNKVESADDSPCSLCIPRLEPNHTIAMQEAVVEMVVELLDKKTEVKLGAYSNIGLTTVDDHFPRRNLGCAALAEGDEWDTLTGLYVALSKATKRKLPDWIYEKESNDE